MGCVEAPLWLGPRPHTSPLPVRSRRFGRRSSAVRCSSPGVRTFHILRDVIGRAYDIRMAHEEKRLTLDEAHIELARLAIPV